MLLQRAEHESEWFIFIKINALYLEMKKPLEKRFACKLLILNGGQDGIEPPTPAFSGPPSKVY